MKNNSKRKLKVAIICGTRPELIKLVPVIKELEARGHEYRIFHTNQHYDANMDKNFWAELELEEKHICRNPKKFVFGNVIEWLKQKLEGYDVVLVQGDTNSVLAGALAGKFVNIPIGHIEAGIRSYDRRMQEECNRQMVDRISSFNFCPTDEAVERLVKENIPDKYNFITGNTIVDAVHKYSENNKDFVKEVSGGEEYIFLTMHRAELVDNPSLLTKMVCLLNLISKKSKCKIIYPIHPRTKKMLDTFKIDIGKEVDNIKVIDPVTFTQTLALEKGAKLIITDSGGIQEEACILGKPCLTIRDNTERQETLGINNRLIKPSEVTKYLKGELLPTAPTVKGHNPYGDGNAGKNIVRILEDNLNGINNDN